MGESWFLPTPGQRRLKSPLDSKAPLPPLWGKGPGDEGEAPANGMVGYGQGFVGSAGLHFAGVINEPCAPHISPVWILGEKSG